MAKKKFNKLEDVFLLKIMQELEIVKGQPRLQILVAHGFIELVIDSLIAAHTKCSKKILSDMVYTHSTKLLILYEIGILSQEDYKLYDWFRGLRNDAAHLPLFALNDDDLKKIKPEKYQSVSEFDFVCRDLVLRLWNPNHEVLFPHFFKNYEKLR